MYDHCRRTWGGTSEREVDTRPGPATAAVPLGGRQARPRHPMPASPLVSVVHSCYPGGRVRAPCPSDLAVLRRRRGLESSTGRGVDSSVPAVVGSRSIDPSPAVAEVMRGSHHPAMDPSARCQCVCFRLTWSCAVLCMVGGTKQIKADVPRLQSVCPRRFSFTWGDLPICCLSL
jgi:hypothetical protein